MLSWFVTDLTLTMHGRQDDGEVMYRFWGLVIETASIFPLTSAGVLRQAVVLAVSLALSPATERTYPEHIRCSCSRCRL